MFNFNLGAWSSKIIELATTTNEKEKLRLLKEIADMSDTDTREEREKFLKFTEKEISKIPKNFRKEFRTNGLRAHLRQRKRGNSINYEIRCRRQSYNISASGITIEEAKQNFINKLNAIDNGANLIPNIPTAFDKFALYYFENYRKRKVSEKTYRNDCGRLQKNIIPYFKNIPIKSVTPSQCQILIDMFSNEGKGKTADEVFSLLNGTFKYAIAHGLINRNPLATVFHQQHDREHGKALTKEEEAKLLSETSGNEKLCFAIVLYTGLRPNEYKTLTRNGNMLIAVNSKRKNKKIQYKRIPVSPMLAPIIGETEKFHFPNEKSLWYIFKKILPERTLYDMRTTFYTRCKECGIAEPALKEMAGHSLGALGNAYTDLSDEYLFKEAQKMKYDLPPILPPKR